MPGASRHGSRGSGRSPRPTREELERAPLYEAGARLAEHVLRPSRPNTDDIYHLHQVLCRALLRPQPAAEAVLAASLAAYSLQQLQRRQAIVPLLAEIESAPWFPDVPDHALVDWHINKGFLLIGVGHVESGTASFEAAAQLARQQGLALLLRSSLVGLARSSMMMGSVPVAQAALQEAEAVDVNPGLHRRVNELIVKAGLELARANPLRALGALDSAQALLSGGGISHSPPLQRARVQVLCALGRHDEAFSFGQDCVKASQGAARDLLECDLVLLTALHAWSTDEGRATECFDRALETVGGHGWTNFLLLLPAEAGLVASRALRRGRAVAVIRDAIRERRLPAPSNEGPRWPWPLRVFVFAGLRLERFDEVVPFQGKVQKKPLELLKFLACARDQQADHAAVCAALWPDADDSAARRSLEMATARLRDMLGNPNWVRVADGRTRLDPAYVWCDVQAVHRLCQEAEGAGHDRLSAARIDEIADGLLALYRGVLLAGEDESPWVIGARERLRGEFVRAVRSAATATQTLEQHERALELLERAVAAEPLAEELAQRLMKAHLQHEQPAEAMRVYRQLRQMLSVLLGTQPAAESDRLRDQALRQQQERSTT